MVERQKAETMAIKQYRVRKQISLFSKKENKNDINNDKVSDQTNDKYPL